MAGRFINHSLRFGLRELRKSPFVYQKFTTTQPTGAFQCTRCVSQSCGLSSQDNHDQVKKDISMQSTYQMANIKPTPFDTLTMVKHLKNSGFTTEQAEALVQVLVGVAVYSSEQALSGHVSHKTLDLLELKLKGQIDSIKSEQVLMAKGTLGRIQDRTEAIDAQTQRLRDQIKEEVGKVEAGVQLDINLERSHNKENVAVMEQKVKDAHHRIDSEIAGLKTTIESQKLELVKYIAGGTVTLVTLLVSVLLGIFRIWK